jgi:hypothetical protein
MPLMARASTTVRNKNLIILVMCFGSMAWFGYDGWRGYPRGDDARVARLAGDLNALSSLQSADQQFVRDWKGWENETPANRERMDKIVDDAKKSTDLKGWKTASEIQLQRYIVMGLGCCTLAAIWWFINCQRRRVIADDQMISPKAGVVVPWEKISKVDNTRWEKVGIVELTYTDEKGQPGKAKLDDYETEREPLLEILDLLAEKAVNAEFFPKEESTTGGAATA